MGTGVFCTGLAVVGDAVVVGVEVLVGVGVEEGEEVTVGVAVDVGVTPAGVQVGATVSVTVGVRVGGGVCASAGEPNGWIANVHPVANSTHITTTTRLIFSTNTTF